MMQEDEIRAAFVAIYDALDDLERLVEVAGATSHYTPPEARPIERLRRLLDLPERERWKKVRNDTAQ